MESVVLAVAALAAGVEGGLRDTAVLPLLGWVGVVLLVGAAAVHLYWAAGGQRWSDDVVPVGADDWPAFEPSPTQTVAVAVAMLVLAMAMAGVLVDGTWWSVAGRDVSRWMVVGGVAVLIVRAIGDGRRVGFSKAEHTSGFARRDDALFTPLVTALALAGSATLLA